MVFIPDIDSERQLTKNQKLNLLGRFFLLMLTTKSLSVFIISISKLMGFPLVSQMFQNEKKLTDSYSIEFSVALLVIILPALEELAFRGWFSRKRLLTAISLTAFVFYFLYIIFYYIFFVHSYIEKIYTQGIIFLLLSFTLYLSYKFFIPISEWIENHYKALFILSSMLFSSIHLLNYKLDQLDAKTLVALLIILLPYPVHAYLFTTLRIRAGLIWSFALHVLGNSFVLIPVFLGEKI